MTTPRSFHPAVHAVARLLQQWYGIVVSACRMPLLASEVARIGGRGGVEGALDRLLSHNADAWDRLLDAITVPETYLFRHFGHFELLRDLVDRRHGQGRRCRVLSAGCSSGEEAWSAAAVLADAAPLTTKRDLVVGWDVNDRRLRIAREGCYRAWSVRSGLRGYDAYFHQHDDSWEVSEALRQRVQFQRVNLVAELHSENAPFDAIFFRNVGIYWEEALGRLVVERLSQLLAVDGLFFFGPSDPGLGNPERWEHVIGGGVRYYRRRLRDTTPPPPFPALPSSPPPKLEPYRPVRAKRLTVSSQFRAVRRSGAARRTKPQPAPKRAASAAPPADSQPQGDPLNAVKHFADAGQYQEALATLESHEATRSLEARLWKGILLLNLERAQESVDLFRQCVFLEPEQPNYRRWLAVAYEAVGRVNDAEREHRNAMELGAS